MIDYSGVSLESMRHHSVINNAHRRLEKQASPPAPLRLVLHIPTPIRSTTRTAGWRSRQAPQPPCDLFSI
eukprot:2609229-Pyramimonas_sp.AAC.2